MPVGAEWADRLILEGDIGYFSRKIHGLREQLDDWFEVADQLRFVVDHIADRRNTGRYSRVDQDVALSRLCLALQATAGSFHLLRSAPVCSLATLSAGQDLLGLALMQLCLRSAGIEAIWANTGATARKMLIHIYRCDFRLLGVNASSTRSTDKASDPALREIATACRDRGIELIVMTDGKRPRVSDDVYRCGSFAELRPIILELQPDGRSTRSRDRNFSVNHINER
jgi:hypothetical protein